MLQSVESSVCPFGDERLDAYFDDELSELERARFERHLATCTPCSETLEALVHLRDGVKEAFPPLACPPEVTAAVLDHARNETRQGSRVLRFRGAVRPRWTRHWRTGLVAAAALVLSVAMWRSLQSPPVPSESAEARQALDPAEVAKAEREARLVLAYVASIGGDAGTKVREEIMSRRLVDPARRAFGFAFGEPVARKQ